MAATAAAEAEAAAGQPAAATADWITADRAAQENGRSDRENRAARRPAAKTTTVDGARTAGGPAHGHGDGTAENCARRKEFPAAEPHKTR